VSFRKEFKTQSPVRIGCDVHPFVGGKPSTEIDNGYGRREKRHTAKPSLWSRWLQQIKVPDVLRIVVICSARNILHRALNRDQTDVPLAGCLNLHHVPWAQDPAIKYLHGLVRCFGRDEGGCIPSSICIAKKFFSLNIHMYIFREIVHAFAKRRINLLLPIHDTETYRFFSSALCSPCERLRDSAWL
jgi:hypothetical protein